MNDNRDNKKRLTKLQNLLESYQRKVNQSFVNHNCEVLIENKLNKQEKYFGRTKYMTPVIFESSNCKIGEIIDVKINSFNQNNLFGSHIVNQKTKAA